MVSKLQKETLIADGQRKEKAEEPKHSDRSVEFKRIKQSNYNENKEGNSWTLKVVFTTFLLVCF